MLNIVEKKKKNKNHHFRVMRQEKDLKYVAVFLPSFRCPLNNKRLQKCQSRKKRTWDHKHV